MKKGINIIPSNWEGSDLYMEFRYVKIKTEIGILDLRVTSKTCESDFENYFGDTEDLYDEVFECIDDDKFNNLNDDELGQYIIDNYQSDIKMYGKNWLIHKTAL